MKPPLELVSVVVEELAAVEVDVLELEEVVDSEVLVWSDWMVVTESDDVVPVLVVWPVAVPDEEALPDATK